MAFGSNPTTTTQSTLPDDQIYTSSVAVPNTANGDLTALEGGPSSTDTNGNKTAPASMYIKDGGDVTQGAKADTAITDATTANTKMSFLKGLVKIFADIWDSVNHRLGVADIEASGYVSATSPPATTNAGSDTIYTFSSQVNRVIIQNNTSANLNFDFDQAASAGSFLALPGTMIIYPKQCTVLHLYTTGAQNINGSTAVNIVVRGAL
jgi:hypothetical protein